MSQRLLFDGSSSHSTIVHIDGGSRGNPGPAAYGVHITRADGKIVELKECFGVATNNVAEYRGLLAALSWAASHGIERLHVRSDSQLLIKQMRGEYRVKHAGLIPLWQEARGLAKQIGDVKFEHVCRELNKDADRLANEAMDEAPVAPR